jgi:hypothetical protein
MRIRGRLLLMALTAATLMSLVVSGASARRFEMSNQTFRLIWPLLSAEIPGTATVSCPVTLEGSFHSRTISKVSGQLVGYITRAFVRGGSAECNGTGVARVNSETLPWHVRYSKFTGALPNITGVELQLVGASVNVDPEGAAPNCNARTTAAAPALAILIIIIIGAKEFRANEAARIPLSGGLCELAGAADLRGTAEVFILGSVTTRTVVRLVQ